MSDREEVKIICRRLGLETISSGKYEGDKLVFLALPYEQISDLPPGIFDKLTSLRRLIIKFTKITILPPKIFDKLTSLEELDLSNNQISKLPPRIFEKLTSLNKLLLDTNHISVLPQGIFDSLRSLNYLWLNGNRITNLPPGILDELTALSGFSLRSNQISMLPRGIFDKLTSLKFLDLDDNQISELPQGIFDKLTSIKNINLRGNQISVPPEIYNKSYLHTEIQKLRDQINSWYELRKQQETKREEKEAHAIIKILKIISQVRVDIPMTLPRLSELVNSDKEYTENILKSILDQQSDLGEYLSLEQVFIKKSEVREEIFTKSTFTDALQKCKSCEDTQSILIRTCTNCGEALPHCNICKRGFVEKDQIIPCPECDNPFHRTHLIAQVQSSGSCPVCKIVLTLSQVS